MFLDTLMHYCSRFISTQINRLLPSSCLLCGFSHSQGQNICPDCQEELPILAQCCPQCAQILTGGALVCGACLHHPPPFDATYALFPYEPPIIQMIIQLKFQQQLSMAKAFGDLMSERIASTWYANKPLPDILLPVPLHPRRLKERGFNQALEIARPIAKALKLPIDFRGIKRIKYTSAQSGLTAALRKQNMVDAFAANREYQGLKIALIDDVVTTGHTITALSKVLKLKGAKRIDIWCCARRDIALKAKTL